MFSCICSLSHQKEMVNVFHLMILKEHLKLDELDELDGTQNLRNVPEVPHGFL